MAAVLSKGEPQTKLENVIKTYGLSVRGRPLSGANCSALRGLYPFVFDSECSAAFETAEMYNPELREPTLLMKIGFACSGRGVSNAKAKDDFAFVMNALRVARLTGEIPKDEKLSVNRIVGRDKKSPGMLHVLLKKQDLVEYIYHEAFLMDETMWSAVETFKTPLSIMQNFATSGANGLVASHWSSSCFSEGMAKAFGVEVDRYRDGVDAKAKAMIDVVWPVWAGDFDNEITELAVQDAQNSSAGFLWHTYLNETSARVGTNYRAFVALCTGVPAAPKGGPNLKGEAAPPLSDSDELQELQGQLKQLRRKTVKFIHLPEVGAASGADYTNSQLLVAWEQLGLGHRFERQEGYVRAFVASAELFPPNIIKQGARGSLSEEMPSEENKFKRVIEFCMTKRGKDDILILCDGRGRDNRRCIESLEKKLTARNHALVECWCVYVQPSKKVDPRVAARATYYSINNKEMVHCNRFASPASPKKGMFRCHRRGQWSWLAGSGVPGGGGQTLPRHVRYRCNIETDMHVDQICM